MKTRRYEAVAHLVTLSIVFYPLAATAYIGPGAGLTAIGTVIALIGGVFLALIGFIWYPLKRLLGIKQKKKKPVTKQINEPAKNTSDGATNDSLEQAVEPVEDKP